MAEEAEGREEKPAVEALLEALQLKLFKGEVEVFGYVGYFGWNYESATALSALLVLNQEKTTYLVNRLLNRALQFPLTGFWIKHGVPVLWLGSPGDRVGLFGSLFKSVDSKIYKYVLTNLNSWPRYEGALVRGYGWKGDFGKFIWADDVFMAGHAILQNDPEEAQDLIVSTAAKLRDEATGLFWHGCLVDEASGGLSYNGVKWARANAWILLAIAEVVRVTGRPLPLLNQSLSGVSKFQRTSGAFGNVVDFATSPDETSLTTAYIYAVAIHKQAFKTTRFVDSARKAWTWLNSRNFIFDGRILLFNSTAGATDLGREISSYDKHVGSNQGPGIGLAVWANEGARRIGLPRTERFDARLEWPMDEYLVGSKSLSKNPYPCIPSPLQAIFVTLAMLVFLREARRQIN